jgi:hypothetical protein
MLLPHDHAVLSVYLIEPLTVVPEAGNAQLVVLTSTGLDLDITVLFPSSPNVFWPHAYVSLKTNGVGDGVGYGDSLGVGD